jgi:hypothetical protein
MRTDHGSWSALKSFALSVTATWAMYFPMDQSPLDCAIASIPLLCILHQTTPNEHDNILDLNDFNPRMFFLTKGESKGCIPVPHQVETRYCHEVLNTCFYAAGLFPLTSPSPFAGSTTPSTMR